MSSPTPSDSVANTARPALWQCGRFRLSLERPLVMGILNVTDDSFSDGGVIVTRPWPSLRPAG